MTHLVADTTGIYLNATSSITTNKITSLRTIRLAYEGVGSVVINTSSVRNTYANTATVWSRRLTVRCANPATSNLVSSPLT